MVCKRRNIGQFVIAASSYIQWLVEEPDIRWIPLAPLGRLAIWRTSVDGIIMGCCSIILRKVVHTPPPFLCAPYGTQLPTAHGLPELVPNGLQLAICGGSTKECLVS